MKLVWACYSLIDIPTLSLETPRGGGVSYQPTGECGETWSTGEGLSVTNEFPKPTLYTQRQNWEHVLLSLLVYQQPYFCSYKRFLTVSSNPTLADALPGNQQYWKHPLISLLLGLELHSDTWYDSFEYYPVRSVSVFWQTLVFPPIAWQRGLLRRCLPHFCSHTFRESHRRWSRNDNSNT